jgi:hypothetical protein
MELCQDYYNFADESDGAKIPSLSYRWHRSSGKAGMFNVFGVYGMADNGAGQNDFKQKLLSSHFRH